MTVLETNLQGCLILEPNVFEDERGYFFESFNQEKFNKATGLNINFIQDNESFSTKGVLRGLHYQIDNYAQAKLVRVVKGNVLDIAVDIRKGSPTFGHYVAVELTETNMKQLFIPRGFAHGFVVLSDTAIFSYKCDNYYNKESEGGIIYNDATLNIDWQLPEESLLISEKDLILPK
ncbi:MAG: dTDP-4-dehydrorhamnose 3,5-epimerase, partial [Xanthomarina sp.]